MSNLQAHNWGKRAFRVLILLLTLTNIFHLLSYIDRRNIRQQESMTRQMLDARAQNQMIFFNAMKRNGILEPAEQLTILGNWEKAEYYTVK